MNNAMNNAMNNVNALNDTYANEVELEPRELSWYIDHSPDQQIVSRLSYPIGLTPPPLVRQNTLIPPPLVRQNAYYMYSEEIIDLSMNDYGSGNGSGSGSGNKFPIQIKFTDTTNSCECPICYELTNSPIM
jgi:hypothetical protein